MVELIPPPDPRSLLPPLLASLPTAAVSPHPSPPTQVLLQLLSPILRQRVLSLVSSPTDSWLRLLCWDSQKADRLQSLVDGTSFEPHPVSGEIELSGDIPVTYRRLDEETLQAGVLVPDYNLKVIYLWCPPDKENSAPGWRVAEVLPYESAEEDYGVWSFSIGDANAHAKEQLMEEALRAAEKHGISSRNVGGEKEDDEEEDDDDYWALYDATPGRTPSVKTPGPAGLSSTQQTLGPSEASYFSRYADVQPAMDNHDPEEEHPELGPTSLLGDIATEIIKQNLEKRESAYPEESNRNNEMSLSHPRPSSASSTSSEAVVRLEQKAETQLTYEVGVKQHIGSNLKSLFRLAKATGISRAEFQALVKTELDLLNISDDDD